MQNFSYVCGMNKWKNKKENIIFAINVCVGIVTSIVLVGQLYVLARQTKILETQLKLQQRQDSTQERRIKQDSIRIVDPGIH